MHVLDAPDGTVVLEILIKKEKKQDLNPQSPDWYAKALTTGLQLQPKSHGSIELTPFS